MCVCVCVGRSGDELCKEWLISKVGRSFLRVRQRWTAAEAQTGDASAQEVERHMGNSSIGPALRTERNTSVSIVIYLAGVLLQSTLHFLLREWQRWFIAKDWPQWAELPVGNLDGTASVSALHLAPLEQNHYKRRNIKHRCIVVAFIDTTEMNSTNHGKSSKMGVALVLNTAMIAGRSAASGSPERM